MKAKKRNEKINFAPVLAAKAARFPDMTDAEFAVMVGVTPSTWSDYNKRGTVPSLLVALTFAKVLDLDLLALLPPKREKKLKELLDRYAEGV